MSLQGKLKMTINDWWKKIYEEHDNIDDFVFIVKDEEGEERVAAYLNVNGGTCDCCCELDVNACNVVKIYNGITLDVLFSEY